MRACSAGLATAIAEECTTLARLWRVTRKDGTILRFTDAVRPITFGGFEYRADVTFTSSAIFTSSTWANAQNVTIQVMMDDAGVGETDLRARKYDGATGEIFVINYETPTDGVMQLFIGTFGRIRICDKLVAEIEMTPQGAQAGNITIGGEVYSPTCRNSLGDSNCQVDLEALKVAITVDTVSPDGYSFTVFGLAQADDYWTQGFIQWLTGDNAGVPNSMVAKSVQATNTVHVVHPTPQPIQVGDTGFIFPGCDKLPVTCRDKFDNIERLRAEPTVPAGDILPWYNPVGSFPT